MKYLLSLPILSLPILCLLLCSCGQTVLRYPPTDSTPAIFYCTSHSELESHVSASRLSDAASHKSQVDGVYVRGENSVYVLTEDPDHLTADEALVLTHELQHAADARFHGSMWALLRAMGHNQHKPGQEAQ